MLKGSNYHKQYESPIQEEMSLYNIKKIGRDVLMFHYDGSISTIIPFKPLSTVKFNESDYVNMFNMFNDFINDLDETEISLQFCMLRENISAYSEEEIDKFDPQLAPIIMNLNELSKRNLAFENHFYVAIHCRNKHYSFSKDNIFRKLWLMYKNRNAHAEKINEAYKVGAQERIRKIKDVKDKLGNIFTSPMLNSTLYEVKDEQETFNILRKYGSPSGSKLGEIKYQPEMEEPAQALFKGTRMEGDARAFFLDDYFHRIYTLESFPKGELFARDLKVIDSAPYEFFYSIAFRKMGYDEGYNKIRWKAKTKQTEASASAGFLGVDERKVREYNRVEQAKDVLVDSGEHAVECSIHFCYRLHRKFLERDMRLNRKSYQEMVTEYDTRLQEGILKRFGRAGWVAEEHSQWETFVNIFPGMANMYNYKLKKTTGLSAMMPYFIPMYDGRRTHIKHNGVNHLLDEGDNLFPTQLLDPALPAWNWLFCGETGSGKSVFVNKFINMAYGETVGGLDPIICIMDIAGAEVGSFYKIAEAKNGEIIKLSGANLPNIQILDFKVERALPANFKRKEIAEILLQNKKIREKFKPREVEDRIIKYCNTKLDLSIHDRNDGVYAEKFEEFFGVKNFEDYKELFIFKKGECKPSTSQMNIIKNAFDTMLSKSASEDNGLDSFGEDKIETLLNECYEFYGQTENRVPYMSDLYNFIEKKYENDLRDNFVQNLLQRLNRWTINGNNSMFDGGTSVNLDNNFIVVDFKGLENQKQLQKIYFLIFSELFKDKMYNQRDRLRIMVRDEAWKMMDNKLARQNMEEDFRTARKNEFVTLTISQLFSDYDTFSPGFGEVIRNQSQVFVIGRIVKPETCEKMGAELRLTRASINKMKTLGLKKVTMPDGSVKSAYSTFMFVYPEEEVHILKNVLHPYEYFLYSSSGEDFTLFSYYRSHEFKEKTIDDLLWFLASGQHKKDENLIKYLRSKGLKKVLEYIGAD